MAASILGELGFPRQVSSVEIKCSKGDATGLAKECDIKVESGNSAEGVKFTRKDLALPYFPNDAKSILKYAPLIEVMNYYGLKVTGLNPGKYEVKLGGKKVAEFTDKQLAEGVDLATAALTVGPVADHVNEIAKAVTDKTNFYHGQIYSPLVLGRNVNAKNPDFKDVAKEDYGKRRDALIAERMQKMPEHDAAIRKALAPRSHLVEVVPAK
jgi:hypothetical protein